MADSSDVKKVLATIKEQDVKYVDFRFTDPRGKWQHLAHTVATVDEELLTEGVMFDGSSIAGWKAINESDMTLMPDCKTAVLDPFAAQTQLVIFCDVYEPLTGPALCARSPLDRQACRGLSEDHRHRRHRLLRAGGRVLRVRRRALRSLDEPLLLRVQVRRGPVWHRQGPGAGQPRPPSADQGRLLPGAAGRRRLRPARGDDDDHDEHGPGDGEAPPRGGAQPARARPQVLDAREVRRQHADLQVRRAQRRALLRQDRDLHAEAGEGRQRLGHALPPVDLEGRQAAVRGLGLRRPLGHARSTTSAASSSTPRR